MFFDKHYRPERYTCIINDVGNHRNINEFRTYVMHKYYRFPAASASFLKIGGYKKDFAQLKVEVNDTESIESEREDNS